MAEKCDAVDCLVRIVVRGCVRETAATKAIPATQSLAAVATGTLSGCVSMVTGTPSEKMSLLVTRVPTRLTQCGRSLLWRVNCGVRVACAT